MVGKGFQSALSEEEDYEVFRSFLEKVCGIILGENKQYLVHSRLHKILKEKSIPNLSSLVREIEAKPFSDLKQIIIDAMTTNETLWFRDRHPFDYLTTSLLKETAKDNGNRIRIWSAACSTGQEPYSLSICVNEARKRGGISSATEVQIVATDISTSVLNQAKSGRYESLALGRGLSQERLKYYFHEMENGEWEVKPDIKRNIDFRILNLQDSYSLLGKFDIVFCRNVLIYFSAEFKLDILRRIHACLKPGGYLFLGASESLNGLSDIYSMCQYHPGIVYRTK